MVGIRYLFVLVTVIGSEIYYVNDICPHKYGMTNVFVNVCPS